MRSTPDHDLLIQIDTKLTLLAETVSAFGPKFEALDARKADAQDVTELKTAVNAQGVEIESLQRFRWMFLGGVAILELAMHALLKF